MASFKALCLAGVASLAVTAAAQAADLLPPPPAVEMPRIAFTGGWYLRGDVGVGIADYQQRNSTFAPGVVVPGLQYNQSSFQDSGFVDGGVGYRINQYFRFDVTGEYRTSSRYSAIESFACGAFCPPGFGPRLYDTYGGSTQAVVGLANGYIDLGTWYGVTPFIGGGVGFARIGVTGVYDQGQTGGFGFAGSHYQTNFAFAAMAGLDFAVTERLKLEIGYRYLDMGNAASAQIACTAASACESQRFHLVSNDVRLGFRYLLDVAPPPPPVLVSKY